MINITSKDNPKYKLLKDLKKSSVRKKSGLFIIEGLRENERALQAGFNLDTLFLAKEIVKDGRLDKLKNVDYFTISKKLFELVSIRQNPDGVLGIYQAQKINLNNLKLGKNPLVIVLEKLENPGNIGAILRTADASGADAVIINEELTDLYNPNVIRASQGALFSVKAVVAEREDTINWLNKNKIKTFATTPHTTKTYLDADYTEGSAIIMGNEYSGISNEWLDKVDEKIKITMRGQADSLNVSVATAIVVFEAIRQREKE